MRCLSGYILAVRGFTHLFLIFVEDRGQRTTSGSRFPPYPHRFQDSVSGRETWQHTPSPLALEPNFICAVVKMFASLLPLGLLSCLTNELTVALRRQTKHRCPAHFLGFHSLRVLTLSFQVPASC